jgi:hypothetical protein
MIPRLARAVVAVVSVAGCSESAAAIDPIDGSVTDDGASPDGVARADAGPNLGQPPPPDDGDAGTTGCPVDPPRPPGRCNGPFRDCSYGDDPLAVCRPRFECIEGTWHHITPTPCDVLDACPDGPDASVCPARLTPCFTTDARLCRCSPDVDGGAQWRCAPAGEGCPVLAPNMGTPCAVPDGGDRFECRYGPDERCGPDFFITCVDGLWQAALTCTE